MCFAIREVSSWLITEVFIASPEERQPLRQRWRPRKRNARRKQFPGVLRSTKTLRRSKKARKESRACATSKQPLVSSLKGHVLLRGRGVCACAWCLFPWWWWWWWWGAFQKLEPDTHTTKRKASAVRRPSVNTAAPGVGARESFTWTDGNPRKPHGLRCELSK